MGQIFFFFLFNCLSWVSSTAEFGDEFSIQKRVWLRNEELQFNSNYVFQRGSVQCCKMSICLQECENVQQTAN